MHAACRASAPRPHRTPGRRPGLGPQWALRLMPCSLPDRCKQWGGTTGNRCVEPPRGRLSLILEPRSSTPNSATRNERKRRLREQLRAMRRLAASSHRTPLACGPRCGHTCSGWQGSCVCVMDDVQSGRPVQRVAASSGMAVSAAGLIGGALTPAANSQESGYPDPNELLAPVGQMATDALPVRLRSALGRPGLSYAAHAGGRCGVARGPLSSRRGPCGAKPGERTDQHIAATGAHPAVDHRPLRTDGHATGGG